MKRKTKDYAWPRMFYCKADGSYLVCPTLADVPDGFVDTRQECDVQPGEVEEPKPYMGARPATEEEAIVADEDADDTTPATAEDGEPITLKSLGVSRKEAIAALKEEKVVFNAKATNDELAALVHALLSEAEDGDEDEGETEE